MNLRTLINWIAMGVFKGKLPTPQPPAPVPTPDEPPRPLTELAADLVEAIDWARERHRAERLNQHGILLRAAQSHADWMARTGQFSHIGENGTDNFQRAALLGWSGESRENIAKGYATAAEAVDSWLSSPGHRRIMLGNWHHVGVGVAKGRDGQLLYVGVFG